METSLFTRLKSTSFFTMMRRKCQILKTLSPNHDGRKWNSPNLWIKCIKQSRWEERRGKSYLSGYFCSSYALLHLTGIWCKICLCQGCLTQSKQSPLFQAQIPKYQDVIVLQVWLTVKGVFSRTLKWNAAQGSGTKWLSIYSGEPGAKSSPVIWLGSGCTHTYHLLKWTHSDLLTLTVAVISLNLHCPLPSMSCCSLRLKGDIIYWNTSTL